uniref:Uncharacterized protein n=1 Tax=Riptortus pedestris TaxID=329032 RepID=R4WCH6_RIPPE|nr:unknown secreted protein [Riptortus pedestris]
MKAILAVVVILGFLATGRADLTVINEAVDKLLVETREVLLRNGSDTLHLEEFQDQFTYRWHFIKVKSYLHCWDGWLKNTSTIQRTGDVVMDNSTSQMTLIVPLNLTDFQFHFNSCRVDIKHLVRKTDQVTAKIGKNALEAKVTLNLSDNNKNCTATLDQLKFTKMAKIEFHSAHMIEDALDRILPFITKHITSQLTSLMTHYLNDLVKEYVPNATFCYDNKK